MSSDSWLTTIPPEHEPECNCEKCHDWHVDEGLIYAYYENIDYPCCTDAINEWIQNGKCCGQKPKDHGDIYMKDGHCLRCGHNQSELLKAAEAVIEEWNKLDFRVSMDTMKRLADAIQAERARSES